MSALALRHRCKKAAEDDAFSPNDSLDAALCHGDVLLQICANTQDTVIHALRDIIKHTPDLLSVRWKAGRVYSRSRGA
ncbi:Dyp-type peroxidase domain-containing protein [Enterobacter hormaechei]